MRVVTNNRVALNLVLVALASAIGVSFSSQVLLDEAVRTTVENAVVSGVIAAVVFAAATYVRRNWW
jgi:hypothetical protein